MGKLFAFVILSTFVIGKASAQEYFTISHYDVIIKINTDASLEILEKINVHYTEPRHGIIRKIPYKYKVQDLPAGAEKASLPMQWAGYNRTIVEDIKVPGWDFDVSNEGDYKVIKIGSADKNVDGNQQYIITYRLKRN
jgi:Predicted membrane protein (DUF2207)